MIFPTEKATTTKGPDHYRYIIWKTLFNHSSEKWKTSMVLCNIISRNTISWEA